MIPCENKVTVLKKQYFQLFNKLALSFTNKTFCRQRAERAAAAADCSFSQLWQLNSVFKINIFNRMF